MLKMKLEIFSYKCLQLPSAKSELCSKILNKSLNNKIYYLGRNEHSRALSKLRRPDAIIDDYRNGDLFDGVPVVAGDAVEPDGIIVNCTLCNRPLTASIRAQKICPSRVLEYGDLLAFNPAITPVPMFVAETDNDLILNREKWFLLYELLHDDLSRKVLQDILSFRLTGHSQFMADYSYRPTDQYFEPFIEIRDGAIFVDCGGFDGDTTEQFCNRFPDYRKVYIFEPSRINLEKAKKRLGGLSSINLIEKGVSDKPAKVFFDDTSGSASSVSDHGGTQIILTTIDSEVKEKIDFIKMDLEGWEPKALAGACGHIADDRPCLAITVYHHPSHFWKLQEFITCIQPDYRVYLRHYTEGWAETVMYFVPA